MQRNSCHNTLSIKDHVKTVFSACSKHSGSVDPIGNPGIRATKDALNIQKEQVLKENPCLDKYQSNMKESSLNVERALKCREKRISLCVIK